MKRVVDVETTIFQKGNPFARRNKLCYVGILDSELSLHRVDVDATGLVRDEARDQLPPEALWVGFNFKFDLHWLRREGFTLPSRVWDCQLAHFLLTGQKQSYPSLNEVCEHYGIPGKFGYIEENYWSKGIDTPDIPEQEMLDYLAQDLKCTSEVYHRQLAEFEANPRLYNLFKMDMSDLLVLQDMEWNGLKFNTGKAQEQEREIKRRIAEIEEALQSRVPNTPVNWDSGDHLSAYVYGGRIVVDRKEMVGVYQSGEKLGQPRYRWFEDVYEIPRLVEPLEGSELKKADKEKGTGPWSTAEDVLKQVKQVEQVKLILERAKLTKLLDYLSGYPSLIVEKDWNPNELHGQFNQVVARTGRLSSSNPNLQNQPDEVKGLIETRYA